MNRQEFRHSPSQTGGALDSRAASRIGSLYGCSGFRREPDPPDRLCPVTTDPSDPMQGFETWLLSRVAQAVEAGHVPADLLMELQRDFQASRAMPQVEGHARAVQDIAGRLGVPTEEVERGLKALEAQPTVTRELLMRGIAEAWLEEQ